MIGGRRAQAKRLTAPLLGSVHLLLLEQGRAEIVMRHIRIGIERDCQTKLAQSLLRLVIQQQRLAEDAMFGGPSRVLAQSQLQFPDRAVVILLRHVRAGETTMSSLPLGMLAIEFVQLCHGLVKLVLVAIGVAQIVADRRFLRSDALGLAILIYRLDELSFLMQHEREVRVSFPE